MRNKSNIINKNIAVIGAGPAGLSAAYILNKNNFIVDVYEASPRIGGMSCTIELWNQKVDLGPHRFFSRDKRVNDLWLEIVKSDYHMVNRLTRVLYKGKFFHYPIKILDVLRNLGISESFQCVTSYLFERIKPTVPDGSFENWVKGRFGRRLYEIFFKTYSEKLWGINCKQLDSDFAAQRIKKLSFFEALRNAVSYNSNRKKNQHITLVEQFAYPHDGSGSVYERMGEKICAHGNNIFLNTQVYCVLTNGRKAVGIELIDGTKKYYDHIISTMPFSEMVKRLPNVPVDILNYASELTYRNTILVYLLIEDEDIFKDNWIYIHSPQLQMGRITNFRNWSPGLYGKEKRSIMTIEYWCNDNDAMWSDDDNYLINLATDEIVTTGLVKRELVADGYVFRIHKAYPVYSKGYKNILQPINQYINGIEGLTAIGRNGSFKYNNQDHSILMGLLAAENIMGIVNHKLDEINSDYETYQESYIVTKTGLVKQNFRK